MHFGFLKISTIIRKKITGRLKRNTSNIALTMDFAESHFMGTNTAGQTADPAVGPIGPDHVPPPLGGLKI